MTKYISILVLILAFKGIMAQPSVVEERCTSLFDNSFVSDGQQYRALLNGDEVAEFHATFYENNKYRIVACGARDNQTIIFTVYDSNRNLLYSNKDFNNTPVWDLYFTSTTDCIIEARIDATVQTSGIAFLFIGFKN